MIWPLQKICFGAGHLPCPQALWVHGAGITQRSDYEVTLAPQAQLSCDGYANLLNAPQWQIVADIQRFGVVITGQGQVTLSILRDGISVLEQDLILTGRRTPIWVDAAHGIMTLRLETVQGADIAELTWVSDMPPLRIPKIALVIPTYQRAARVRATVARLLDWMDQHAVQSAAEFGIIVIDHDQALDVPPHPALSVIAAPNLGGSGGFARGLIRARETGFTHALLMDDDADLPCDALTRIAALFRHAPNPKLAVAGAMIARETPDRLWEDGARFDRVCRPRFHDLNLADPSRLLELEVSRLNPLGAQDYGGFWCFALPLSAMRHMPYPFFLRGDDSGFCLANQFDLITMAGVFAVQDGFGGKANALTTYFDLRYHLHHHLVHPHLNIGARATATVALRLIWRAWRLRDPVAMSAGCHAWRDMMRGPEQFDHLLDLLALKTRLGRVKPALVSGGYAMGLWCFWAIRHKALCRRYRAAYPRQTSLGFWRRIFAESQPI